MFVNREAADWPLPSGPRWRRVVCPIDGAQRGRRYRYEQLTLPGGLRAAGLNVVHSLAYVSPLRTPCPAVVTVHDLNFLSSSHRMQLARRQALKVFVKLSLRRAAGVVADSEFGRAELCRVYGLDRDRVTVIYEAPRRAVERRADSDAVLARLGVVEPYLIAFSSASPHKNLARLIDAYTLARGRGAIRQSLLIVGHQPSGPLAARNDVVWSGYRPSPEVEALLRRADAFVFPSLYEGFGLPLLEAMRANVPVIASGIPVVREVAGDAAAYFDPCSVADIAARITAVLSDPPMMTALRERGQARASLYSWEATALATLDLYWRVAE